MNMHMNIVCDLTEHSFYILMHNNARTCGYSHHVFQFKLCMLLCITKYFIENSQAEKCNTTGTSSEKADHVIC